jgi:hypothetical protein
MSLSKIISGIFHPIFIPSFVVLVVISQFTNILILTSQIPFIIIGVLFFTLFLPLISMFYLLITKKIDSLEMSKKEERPLPLAITFFLMIAGYYVMQEALYYTPMVKAIYLGSTYILIITIFITRAWKISLHMLGMGGATGGFIALQVLLGGLYQLTLLAFFLSGIVGYARIQKKAHNLEQIYAGFLLGLFWMFIFVVYL